MLLSLYNSGKGIMKKHILLVTVLAIGLLISGCINATPEKGLLQGKVSIGPTSPVEMPGDEVTLRCEFYEARKIMIYDKDGTELLIQVDIECNSAENYARYRVELDPGFYTVDINNIGVDFTSDAPTQVEIVSGTTVRLDIDIDTGIR
jgi:hypothetical protein